MLDIDENLTVTLTAPREQLSPAQAFRAAEQLIRAATRRIIQSEADRAAVFEVLDGRAPQ
jgi:hypothetical protein